MKQNLVLWGDIGTDRKALIAIYLQEEKNRVHIYAYPREKVSSEVMEKLFAWKSGAEFEFPEDILHWEVSAASDNILPQEIKVDKPEIVTRAQAEWGRIIMSSRLFEVLKEEIGLLTDKLENLKEYDKELWERAKELWNKITDYKKKDELSWEQTETLKNSINTIFDTLKAMRRLDTEKEDDTSIANFHSLEKKINDAMAKLIYPDEWNKLFEVFKAIQEEVKTFRLRTGQRRQLFDKLDNAFTELRKYRKADFVNRNKSRITNLERTIQSVTGSIQQDRDNYEHQYEKLKHYTRGKLSEAEMKERLKHIIDRIEEKEKKVKDIQKTIKEIHHKMAKEEKADEKRREKEKAKKEKPHTAATLEDTEQNETGIDTGEEVSAEPEPEDIASQEEQNAPDEAVADDTDVEADQTEEAEPADAHVDEIGDETADIEAPDDKQLQQPVESPPSPTKAGQTPDDIAPSPESGIEDSGPATDNTESSKDLH